VTKEENANLEKWSKRALSNPVIVLPGKQDALINAWKHDAKRRLQEECLKVALQHGLPKIAGHYGVWRGEFIANPTRRKMIFKAKLKWMRLRKWLRRPFRYRNEQWSWQTMKDDRVCPTCAERAETRYHRKNLLAYPPHPFCESEDGCRCTAVRNQTKQRLEV